MALVGSTFVMVIVETRKSFTTGKEVLNANDNFVGRRGTNESCKALPSNETTGESWKSWMWTENQIQNWFES